MKCEWIGRERFERQVAPGGNGSYDRLRGRTAWSVLLLVVGLMPVFGLLPAVGLAQPFDSWNVEFVGQTGGDSFAAAVSGTHAYAACGDFGMRRIRMTAGTYLLGG